MSSALSSACDFKIHFCKQCGQTSPLGADSIFRSRFSWRFKGQSIYAMWTLLPLVNSLNRFIFYIGGVWLVFYYYYRVYLGILEFNNYSVDPDQTLRCFPVSFLWMLGINGLKCMFCQKKRF